MKNKKLSLLSITFVVIIAASVFLYNALSPNFKQRLNDFESSALQSNRGTAIASPSNDAWIRTSGQPIASSFPAPDFTVYDAAGEKHKLSDFKGKPVVLNFWASWCTYCREEMPLFEEAYKSFGSTVQFMMIDAVDGQRETLETGKAYVQKNGLSFPVFYDTSLEAVSGYGIQAYPDTFFIDKDGNLAASVVGRIDPATLKQNIELINK